MGQLNFILPDSSAIQELLPRDQYSEALETLLRKNLIHPVADFFGHPGKNIRPLLVKLGYLLAKEEETEISIDVGVKLSEASAIVEMIHNGSLIVDDIQDGSEVRRNAPSMHVKHGVPIALNAGNWLYFRALRLVQKLDLSPHISFELMGDLIHLMEKAHIGQALDLGTDISQLPQDEVKSTALTSMELKTGTLLSLALRLGMAIAGESEKKQEIMELGSKAGLLLQMYDDLGNFFTLGEKQFEDLYNKRPTWVWAKASELPSKAFGEFKASVEALPETKNILRWSQAYAFRNLLLNDTNRLLSDFIMTSEERFGRTHRGAIFFLNHFKATLENSYVKKS